jgi:arsenate reductase-like glutaredoxin family protein
LDLFPLKNKEIEVEKNIKIKTVHKDETRAFLFPMNFNFEDLMSKLSGEYQQTNISINYIDEEDETITICSNEELFEATEFFKNNGKSLRFLIKINEKFIETMKETENSSVQINNEQESKITKMKEDRVKAVVGDLLGAGAFGRVYLGMNVNNGGLIAIKQIPIKGNKNKKSVLKEVIKEINLMKSLNHENIVRYLGAEESNEYLQIYLEYVSGGSIQQLLSKFQKFQESVVILYTKQILSGLKYLHDNDIIHRDIKGGNILLTENGVIKLADFGHSKSLNELDSKKSYKGTPFWMSPEIASNFQYSKSSDIWALVRIQLALNQKGCTIVEMLTGKPPYPKLLHLTNPL